MRASTLTEKVIARAAGCSSVQPGDEVWAEADRVIMNDSSGPRRIAGLVEELGGVGDPEKLVVASDHFVPASTQRHAEILCTTRAWAAEQGVRRFFEYDGILHNLVLERALASAGMLLLGADSHTCTAGAVGAVAVPVGSTELATVVATGRVWLSVPQAVHVELTGELPADTDVRDVVLGLLGDGIAQDAFNRAVEYTGSFVDGLDLDGRLVLANQGIEMGAKNATVVPASDNTEPGVVRPDPAAEYVALYRVDVGATGPRVARPPRPDNVVGVDEVAGCPIDMAWIGSCVGGRRSDLRAAAAKLAGKEVLVPLLVTPATRQVYSDCLADGTIATLVAAGATVATPGCGSCAGVHCGVQADGDRVIATATRNFPGRMGARGAQVHLASAATVAASALAGRIADPREAQAARQAGGES